MNHPGCSYSPLVFCDWGPPPIFCERGGRGDDRWAIPLPPQVPPVIDRGRSEGGAPDMNTPSRSHPQVFVEGSLPRPREDPPKFLFFHVCSSAAIRACARGPALGRRQEVSRWCETKLQNTPGSLQYCLRRWQTVFAPPGCAMQRNPLEDPAFLRGKGASWLSHGGRDSPLLRYGWYLVYPFFFFSCPCCVVWHASIPC